MLLPQTCVHPESHDGKRRGKKIDTPPPGHPFASIKSLRKLLPCRVQYPDPLGRPLAPHFDRSDRQAALITFSPCGEPARHAVEELLGCLASHQHTSTYNTMNTAASLAYRGRFVSPRLVADTLSEEAVHSADGVVGD